LIYRVKFFVEDVSTQFNNNNVYRILLDIHNCLEASFFPVKVANLWEDKKAEVKVKKVLNCLLYSTHGLIVSLKEETATISSKVQRWFSENIDI
jgi:hypothetical protein